jgi:hypothetical protein
MVMDKTVGIIYYTDCHLREPIWSMAQKYIKDSGLPIVSCSLKPINFGKNIVLEGELRSYPTMCKQILTALENLDTDYVFFCEHDVLYHPSHFDFIPPRDDTYYYNVNNWRWWFGFDKAISYDELTSLSSLCCNRKLAIEHYKYRLKLIDEWGLDKIRSREPRWARKFGYEPGTKKRRNGGVTDEEHVKRKSEFPNIDIRHRGTFSAPKITLDSFKHPPTNFREWSIDEIPGWNLKELFKL